MPKTSLVPDARFPHVPEKAIIEGDPTCRSCPMFGHEDHATCAAFGPGTPATEDERINGTEIIQAQTRVHRMQIDAEGIQGAEGYKFYRYNARRSLNYADFSSWEVISVSGKNAVLKPVDGGDPRVVPLYTYREVDPETYKWVTGFLETGTLQPTDRMRFSSNSKANRTWPMITRILSTDLTEGTQTVETDKDLAFVLSKIDPEDLNPITCKVYHQEGDRELWRPVIRPEYFFGVLTTLELETEEVDLLPADGIYLLADVPVMHTTGFNPLKPTWVFEGRASASAPWEVVSEANKRLFLTNTASYVAFRKEKPSFAHDTESVFIQDLLQNDDLSPRYTSFRITYYYPANPDSLLCEMVGYSRCRWSIPDPTKSVGNMDATRGVAVNGEGDNAQHYWCHKKNSDEHDIVPPVTLGAAPTAAHKYEQPSGLDLYVSNCRLCNVCNHFDPAEVWKGDGTDPFRGNEDIGLYYSELLSSSNHCLKDLTVPAYDFKQPQRLGHSSYCWLVGYNGIQTPNGWHPATVFYGMGLWSTMAPRVYTNDLGDQSFDLTIGPFETLSYDTETLPIEGNFPREVPGFTATRNPLDSSDLTYYTNEFERIGAAVEKDTGALISRGLHRSTVSVAPQDVVLPDFQIVGTLEEMSEEQHRSQGGFYRRPDGVGVVRVYPLRQEVKAAEALGSRTFNSVSVIGVNTYKVSWDNGPHTWSTLNIGDEFDHYDSYDQLFTFNAGGVYPICPPDSQSVNSFYESPKQTGGQSRGARPGDSIGLDLEGESKRRWVILYNQAFGGDPAPDWGSNRYDKYKFRIPGMWEPSPDNTVLVVDGDEYGNISPVEGTPFVQYASSGIELTEVESVVRPTSIAAGTYWRLGNQILFSPDDDTEELYINYLVAEKPFPNAYFESHTVSATWELTTPIVVGALDGEWGVSMVEATASLDGAYIGAPVATPTQGQWGADITGELVTIVGSSLDAGKDIELSLKYSSPAQAPEDHYYLDGKGLDYAKNMDISVVYDETGDIESLTPGTVLTFWTCDAVMLPGATLEWTARGTNNWEAVPCTVWHGTGELFIESSWFGDKVGPICFRVKNVRLLDHRGIIPASLTNKVNDALDNIEWVQGGMTTGDGSYFISLRAGKTRDYQRADEPDKPLCERGWVEWENIDEPYTPVSEPRPSSFIQRTADSDSCGLVLKISATQLAYPECFNHIPTDTVIEEAIGVFSAAELEYHYYQNQNLELDCNGKVLSEKIGPINEYNPQNIAFAVIGFVTPENWERIGEAVAPDPNKSQVLDITDIVKKMWEAHKINKYPSGYGLILIPVSLDIDGSTGGWMDLVPDYTGGLVEGDFSCSGGCPSDFDYYGPMIQEDIGWDSTSLTDLRIKVKYSDEEKSRTLIMPRIPAQHDPV